MNYELEIAFDFKNSKEYFVRYEPIELTDSEKIPEKLKNKKLYVFEKVKPKAKNIGTFLLEFLNLDFSNALHLNYFLVHYFLVNFIASKKNYLNFEYYKSIDLTSEIMDNPKIILTEDEFIDYAEGTKLLYFSFIDSTQFVFRNIAEKIYFKTLFESSTEEDSDYESLKILKDNETYESILDNISENFKDIKMNFDLDSFFLCSNNNKSKDNIRYYYSSNDFTCLLFICMKEFMNYKNSFRIIKCKNCNHYFIPKTAHKTLYCDNIFKDDLTCKEFADKVSSSRTYANDPICKKYRNRYKNLSKQASISNNPEVLSLYERYKVDGAVMLDKYKHDEISGSDFKKWIDRMKIRK